MQLFAGPEDLCLVRLAEGSEQTERKGCAILGLPLCPCCCLRSPFLDSIAGIRFFGLFDHPLRKVGNPQDLNHRCRPSQKV